MAACSSEGWLPPSPAVFDHSLGQCLFSRGVSAAAVLSYSHAWSSDRLLVAIILQLWVYVFADDSCTQPRFIYFFSSFGAFYKRFLFYRFSPGKEQQGCFHGNAEASDWQPAVPVLLLPNPQNELPLHCSKYWAFPEPSGGASGDLRALARLRRRALVRRGSPVAGIPQINPTRQLSLLKHQREASGHYRLHFVAFLFIHVSKRSVELVRS